MERDRRLNHRSHEGPIKGFSVTAQVVSRLADSPHLRFELPNGGTISILFRSTRRLGVPSNTVFYRWEAPTGVRHAAVSEVDRRTGLATIGETIGQDVLALVDAHDAQQRQVRKEAQEARRRQAEARAARKQEPVGVKGARDQTDNLGQTWVLTNKSEIHNRPMI